MKNGTMTHFSLCSGIGGLDLAAEWAGFETVGQCEIDKYASRVLAKNFEGVKNYGDIRTITAERLAGDGVGDITVLSAGIPCQPYSLAGKGLGDCDSRDLEQELVRVVGEVRPKWLVVENTPGLFARKNQRYFDRIVNDISALGYGVAWGLWGACDVGAPQQRERVFIICRNLRNPDSVGRQKGIVFKHIVDKDVRKPRENKQPDGTNNTQRAVPNAGCERKTVRRHGGVQQATINVGSRRDIQGRVQEYGSREWWQTEPGVGRVVAGVPDRVDRLRCLGNAVVPYQAYPIFKAIAEIERGEL